MISGYLPVSGGHRIYYETHGTGRPAVLLHGGPGGGMDRHVLAAFDLKKWCVVMFDQRGCGKSTPFGSLAQNTTWNLIDDIETLRCHLGFDQWFVSGGSWGTTLALVYAETYPSRVSGMLLRGVSLCDEASFKWMYQVGGASEIHPEGWASFVSVLPPRLHNATWRSIMRYYQSALKGSDAQRYADAWWKWENLLSFISYKEDDTTPKERLALSLLENHYFVHGCWLKKDQILHGLYKLRHIPITIVHGRYDLVCPVSAAYAIQKELPHVTLSITPDAGHAFMEPGTRKRYTQSTRSMLKTYAQSVKRKTAKKSRN